MQGGIYLRNPTDPLLAERTRSMMPPIGDVFTVFYTLHQRFYFLLAQRVTGGSALGRGTMGLDCRACATVHIDKNQKLFCSSS